MYEVYESWNDRKTWSLTGRFGTWEEVRAQFGSGWCHEIIKDKLFQSKSSNTFYEIRLKEEKVD